VTARYRPVVLCVLDGWGIAPDTPANAVTVIPATPLPPLAQLQQVQPAPIEHVVTVKVAPSTPEPRVSLSGAGSSGVGTGTNVITYATPEVTGGEAAAGKPA